MNLYINVKVLRSDDYKHKTLDVFVDCFSGGVQTFVCRGTIKIIDNNRNYVSFYQQPRCGCGGGCGGYNEWTPAVSHESEHNNLTNAFKCFLLGHGSIINLLSELYTCQSISSVSVYNVHGQIKEVTVRYCDYSNEFEIEDILEQCLGDEFNFNSTMCCGDPIDLYEVSAWCK